MNEEAQELLNRQFDKRIAKMEDTIDNIQKDLTEVKCDMKLLIQHTNRSNGRWEEFDKQQRKNKNDILMKIALTIVGAMVAYVLATLKICKYYFHFLHNKFEGRI